MSRLRLRVAAGLFVAAVAAGGAGAGPLAASSFNPGRSVEAQLAHLQRYWPQQFAVLLVEVTGTPTRLIREADVVYCDQEVRAVEPLLVRWLRSDPPAPADAFRIHYWIRPARPERHLSAGERVIVFLAPARFRGVFVTEMILGADERTLAGVRRVLAALPPP